MNRPLSAGSIVETECTRCRALMNHTIVAMVGEKIVRVECNTCHGTHNYRPAKAPKEPSPAKAPRKTATAPRRVRVDPEGAARAEWAALQPEMDAAQAIPYDMNRTYRANDLLLHPRFGLGIVRVVVQSKMDVLFQEGKKRLRCG